jgi:sulfur carrier protein ThiS
MEVSISLFGNLGHYLPQGGNRSSFTKSLTDGTTVADLLQDLNLAGKVSVVVVVNDRAVDMNHVLKANDRIGVFRPSGGG